jgi:aspartate ammonia-lyase
MAAEAGQLQLNAFEPIIVRSLSESITHLTAACHILAERCVDGITANPTIMAQRLQESLGLATALNPLIGYQAATQVAREALATGRTVPEIVLQHGHLTAEQLFEALRPERLANLPIVVNAAADPRR